MQAYIHFLKFSIKNIIAYFLYYSGILSLVKKYKLGNKSIVLTYHRVIPESISQTSFSTSGIIVTPETFNKHIIFLKRNFSIQSINEFYDTLKKPQPTNKTPCLITFDDGWIDNYIYAFPIIKKNKIPVTIFIPIDYIESNKLFWQEQLSRAIFNMLDSPATEIIEFLEEYKLESVIDQDKTTRKSTISEFVRGLKQRPDINTNELHEKVVSFSDLSENEINIDRYLDWDHISEMQNAGINFGSHACTHKILTHLAEDKMQKELESSASKILEIGGNTTLTIAYPNGDSNQSIQKIAKDTGYLLGFGTQPGSVSTNDNLLDIKRINIHEGKASNIPLLMMAILGLY